MSVRLTEDFLDLLSALNDVDARYLVVIGLDDLIANKRAAGREQDLADVAVLERIRRMQP